MLKSKVKSNHILMFILLLVFWLILSPKRDFAGVVIGIIISFSIIYFNKDFIVAKEEKQISIPRSMISMILYAISLVSEVIKSNIQVAKIVLSPSLPIEPHFVKVPVKMEKDIFKVLYGNSITLTPGTLTVDILEDYYIVHALTKESAEGLKDSIVERKVLRIEGKRNDS